MKSVDCARSPSTDVETFSGGGAASDRAPLPRRRLLRKDWYRPALLAHLTGPLDPIESPAADELSAAPRRSCTARAGGGLRAALLHRQLRQAQGGRVEATAAAAAAAPLARLADLIVAAARAAVGILCILCIACTRDGGPHGGPDGGHSAAKPGPPPSAGEVEAARTAVAHGRTLFAARDFAGARSAFALATQKDPRSAEAFFWAGRAYVVTTTGMSYSRAIEDFERALALDPQLVQAHWGLGLAHFNLAHNEAAEREFTAYLAAAGPDEPAPMLAEAHHFLGVLAGSAGAVDQALAQFAAAEKLNPTWADVPFERGRVLETAGRTAEAVASFEAATRLEPNHLPAHFRLSRLLRGLGREADALREEKIHRVLNELTDNMTGRATRDPENRLALYGELAALDPGNRPARLEYARALIELRRTAEAELALDDLLRDAPDLGDAYVARARLALERGQKEKAAELVAALAKRAPAAVASLPEPLKSLLPPK
jgi:tetratricopeptide (TPR) repeat protein